LKAAISFSLKGVRFHYYVFEEEKGGEAASYVVEKFPSEFGRLQEEYKKCGEDMSSNEARQRFQVLVGDFIEEKCSTEGESICEIVVNTHMGDSLLILN